MQSVGRFAICQPRRALHPGWGARPFGWAAFGALITACSVDDRTLSVASDGAVETPGDRPEGGRGAAPLDGGDAVEVSGPADARPLAAMLSVGSTVLDFGAVTVGATVAPGAIQVTNKGGTATAPLSTLVTGSLFSVGADGCKDVALAPQKSCEVTIRVAATLAGNATGRLTVTDTPSDVVSVALAAQVLASSSLRIDPTLTDFGAVPLGTSSVEQPFTVTNGATATTSALTASLGGSNAAEFTLVDACSGLTLRSQGTCNLAIRFTPATSGPKTAALAVSGALGGTSTASLAGRGLAAASLSVSPATYDFGVDTVGVPGPFRMFDVQNNGGQPSSTLATGVGPGTGTATGEFGIASDGCTGRSLDPGSYCSVLVQFRPATFGGKSATLTFVASNGSAMLTGTGRDLVSLNVLKNGSGTGTVTGDQIDCGFRCTEQVARVTASQVVTLTATPDARSGFAGWSGGGCSGTGPCGVVMSQAQTVTATFNQTQAPLTVNFRALAQPGARLAINPSGTTCATSCSQTVVFDLGTTVMLTVSGLNAGAIGAWSNGCTGTTCAVTVDAAQTVSFTSTPNNIIFVTSTPRDGNLGGVLGGDAICRDLASAAGLPGRYVALLGTTTASGFTRLSGRGWIRPDGLAFGDTIASLQMGALWYPAVLDERGQQVDAFIVQTGESRAAPALATCNDWTANAASATVGGGLYTAEGFLWNAGYGSTCDGALPFYCLGTDFTTPLVLTSQNGLSAGRRAFVSDMAFTGGVGAANADAECRLEASGAALANSANFIALLATTSANATQRLNLAGSPWVRPDGVLIARTTSDFVQGNLLAPVALHANGALVQSNSVWIGSSSSLSEAGINSENCNNWSSSAITAMGWVGDPLLAGIHPWIGLSVECSNAYSVVCLEN